LRSGRAVAHQPVALAAGRGFGGSGCGQGGAGLVYRDPQSRDIRQGRMRRAGLRQGGCRFLVLAGHAGNLFVGEA